MTLDAVKFRQSMSLFTTGVCVITIIRGDGTALGVTINAFTSVSLDPPLILYCLKRLAVSYEDFLKSSHFVVNILSEDQLPIALHCTHQGGGILDPKVDLNENAQGIPLIKGALAHLQCTKEAIYPGGDHSVILSRVHQVNDNQDLLPLIFHKSKFASLNACDLLRHNNAV